MLGRELTDAGPASVDVIAEACCHQLGEAATIIDGYAELLRETGQCEPAVLRAVDGGVDRVRRVVGDLLELTRVAGRDAPHAPHPLAELVERAVTELGSDGAALRVEVARAAPTVVGDGAQLVVAFRQLFRSAAAARDPNQGEVRIAVTGEPTGDGRVLVAIDDDAAAPHGLVGSAARGRGPLVGAGATQLIVSRIVAAHGGSATSVSPDGSRVVLDLPGSAP